MTSQVKIVTAAHADGSLVSLKDPGSADTPLEAIQSWNEKRWKANPRFIGLATANRYDNRILSSFHSLNIIMDRGVYSCTSNGSLSLKIWESSEDSASDMLTASLPTRLRDWDLSPDQSAHCYGGDEVDLSVWDAEKTFGDASTVIHDSKKRKREGDLFPAEVWRAKNLPNDNLGLRQPIQLTSVTFLSRRDALASGTLDGQVRRYDTRAARKPVAYWNGIGKRGGIKALTEGFHEQSVVQYLRHKRSTKRALRVQ